MKDKNLVKRDSKGKFVKGTGSIIYTLWKESEKGFLKNNYKKMGDCEMAKILNRSPSAVSTMIINLGLKRDRLSRKKIFTRLMSGKNNPNFGRKFSEDVRKKQSESRLKGLKEGRIKVWNRGLTKETDDRVKKISEAKIGHIVTEETMEKIKKKKKGRHSSPKTEFKKGDARLIGKKNPNWNGGISFEPYGKEFNESLKRYIRKRDNYTCQECGRKKEDILRELDTHHIDYNKKNNSEFNLISLCVGCHSKTNRNRKHWENYFKMKIFIKELFNPQNIVAFENNKLIGVTRL